MNVIVNNWTSLRFQLPTEIVKISVYTSMKRYYQFILENAIKTLERWCLFHLRRLKPADHICANMYAAEVTSFSPTKKMFLEKKVEKEEKFERILNSFLLLHFDFVSCFIAFGSVMRLYLESLKM